MRRFLSSERRTRWLLAAFVIGVALVWLLSGVFTTQDVGAQQSIAEINANEVKNTAGKLQVAVKARRSTSENKSRVLHLSGQTEVKQIAYVKAETSGRVVSRETEDGDRVKTGTVLCRLELNDKEARLQAAKDNLALAEIRYKSALKLRDQNFERESALIAAKADQSNARHNLALAQKALEDTAVRAPVAGFVEMLHANVGDFLQPGALCATLVNLDPIFLITHVAEKFVDQIALGATVNATLSTGQSIAGTVSFIGKLSAENSRTFRLEVRVANPDFRIRGGLTADIHLPLRGVDSHRIATSMLSTDKNSNLGVYTITDSIVEFHQVAIVADDAQGLWVTGLPATVQLLTVGQDRVSPGDRVAVQFENR
ncbi:MAG: efflux RND transporter periplasmic adaptor subunit [Gammaproteobacteria bacterium]|nr:efflux RND transporter periplasmic adaptor subunit [Gammaproteobacteria bacterium]